MRAMEQEVDPLVRDAVRDIRDRFGADGLRDVIALAQQELVGALAAADELAKPGMAGDAVDVDNSEGGGSEGGGAEGGGAEDELARALAEPPPPNVAEG